jgi:hypothetical protein
MDKLSAQESKQSSKVPAKTPYAAPKLLIHGSVQQITQAVAGNVTDGVNGSVNLLNEN